MGTFSLKAFERDLRESRLVTETDQLAQLSVDDLVDACDIELTALIDIVQLRKCARKLVCYPWFNVECHQSRRSFTRMFELRYRRIKSDADRLA